MINCCLMWKLETENLLAKEQCKFRRNHSTIDQFIRLESTVRNAFVNKQHVAIFFDLEKAYDTTWKSGILSDGLPEVGARLPLRREYKQPCMQKSTPLGVLAGVNSL